MNWLMVALAVTKLNGVYVLPAQPELREYTTFELQDATWRDDGETVIFSYLLPEDMTGRPDYVMTMIAPSADRAREFFHMVCHQTGTTAQCSTRGTSTACVLRFEGLGIEAAAVNQFLDKKYGVSPTTELRKEGAAMLLGDAIGTLSLTPRTEP